MSASGDGRMLTYGIIALLAALVASLFHTLMAAQSVDGRPEHTWE
jgi:hypothetical protein